MYNIYSGSTVCIIIWKEVTRDDDVNNVHVVGIYTQIYKCRLNQKKMKALVGGPLLVGGLGPGPPVPPPLPPPPPLNPVLVYGHGQS